MQTKLSAFRAKISCIEYKLCMSCKERFPGLAVSSSGSCTRCSRDKTESRLYSAANNMDPGPLPLALQGLMQVKEILIAQVMLIMSVYKLPRGQLGYIGRVVNLPQDVCTCVTTLPRSSFVVVVVRKTGESGSHKDFRVRRSRVLSALEWLKENNLYCVGISIDHSLLAQLPVDGDMPDLFVVYSTDESDHRADQNSVDSDGLLTSFVPITHQRMTELETIQRSVQQKDFLAWPQITNTPFNEFQSEGYMTHAFLLLFLQVLQTLRHRVCDVLPLAFT